MRLGATRRARGRLLISPRNDGVPGSSPGVGSNETLAQTGFLFLLRRCARLVSRGRVRSSLPSKTGRAQTVQDLLPPRHAGVGPSGGVREGGGGVNPSYRVTLASPAPPAEKRVACRGGFLPQAAACLEGTHAPRLHRHSSVRRRRLRDPSQPTPVSGLGRGPGPSGRSQSRWVLPARLAGVYGACPISRRVETLSSRRRRSPASWSLVICAGAASRPRPVPAG